MGDLMRRWPEMIKFSKQSVINQCIKPRIATFLKILWKSVFSDDFDSNQMGLLGGLTNYSKKWNTVLALKYVLGSSNYHVFSLGHWASLCGVWFYSLFSKFSQVFLSFGERLRNSLKNLKNKTCANAISHITQLPQKRWSKMDTQKKFIGNMCLKTIFDSYFR